VIWDGQWGDGADAFWGSYSVSVTACDIYGNCGSDSGTILVPLILPPTPTATPAPTPTPVPTQIPTSIPAISGVVNTVSPTTVPPPVIVTEIKEKPQPIHIPWPFFTILGLILGFGILTITDRRPSVLRSLAKQLDKIVSIKNDKSTFKEKP
jgi:hypothetical protein